MDFILYPYFYFLILYEISYNKHQPMIKWHHGK